MLDALYVAMPREPWPPRQGWRARARVVAEANRDLFASAPVGRVGVHGEAAARPGLMAKYEHELGALDGLGLSDLEMDAALTFLLAFVQGVAASRSRAVSADDEEWWAEAGPLLARVVDPERYPLASRVGTAAGEAQGGAYDPDRAYAFGLERVLDGLAALIDGTRAARRRGALGGSRTAGARGAARRTCPRASSRPRPPGGARRSGRASRARRRGSRGGPRGRSGARSGASPRGRCSPARSASGSRGRARTARRRPGRRRPAPRTPRASGRAPRGRRRRSPPR